MSLDPFVDETEEKWMSGCPIGGIAVEADKVEEPGIEPDDVRAERILNAISIPDNSPDYDLWCAVAQLPKVTRDEFEAAVVARWKAAFRRMVRYIQWRKTATHEQHYYELTCSINDDSEETFRCENALAIYRESQSAGEAVEQLRGHGLDLFAAVAASGEFHRLELEA